MFYTQTTSIIIEKVVLLFPIPVGNYHSTVKHGLFL